VILPSDALEPSTRSTLTECCRSAACMGNLISDPH
jgi:hypothetical protein